MQPPHDLATGPDGGYPDLLSVSPAIRMDSY
jgi:hypothetical protein